MTALLLSLGSAATFGAADFLGGLASRRGSVFVVTLISQAIGLAVILVLMPFLPGEVSRAALAWGLLAGVGGSVGLLAYFHALTLGAMGVSAPITSLVGATVPVTVGLALGERPGAIAAVGIGLGIAATVLVSRQPAERALEGAAGDEDRPDPRRALLVASAAGLLFGLFFVALDQAPDDSGLWPLVGSRITGLLIVGSVVLRRRPARPTGQVTRQAMGSGVLDMVANTLFLLATREGLLVLASVVTGLYPVAVVVLAWLVLRERLGTAQLTGVVMALGGTALIAL